MIMKNLKFSTFSFFLLSLLLQVNYSFAQSAKGQIIYTTIEEARSTPKSMNGVTFRNTLTKARLETADKNSPFNGVTGVSESWVVPMGDGNALIHGFSVLADKDGDTFFVYFTSTRRDKQNTVKIKGGTGKFMNLEGSGTSSKAERADTGIKEDCCMSSWEIKYKM